MIVRTNDGKKLTATEPAEIVSELHYWSFAQSRDDQTWMAEAAYRARLMTGRQVRCDSPEEFVEDLLKQGFLIEEDDHAVAAA